MMTRRAVLGLLGGFAVGSPTGVEAQRTPLPLIGHVHSGAAEAFRNEVKAFEDALKGNGFEPGRTVTVEYRWADGHDRRLRSIVKELLERRVSLLVTGTKSAAIAAKVETDTTSIVFYVGSDPVRDGLVTSTNNPTGNVTGSTCFSNLLTPLRLGLLLELIPGIRSLGLLVNPLDANAIFQLDEADDAARKWRLDTVAYKATTAGEIDAAFKNLALHRPEALLVLGDDFLNSRAAQIANAALRHSLPTCFADREGAAVGGLMGFGASRTENSFRAGVYASRVLKGEKPADLPVLQPTRFELGLNLRTARALGLTVPPTLLARADEVLE